MPNPKSPTVDLTKAEQAELKKLAKRHNVAQQIGLRGRIVLAAGAGKNNSQIVRDLHVSLVWYGYSDSAGWIYSPLP